MKKKLISLLFLVAFVGIVMVGCANKPTPSQPTTPQTPPAAQQPAGQMPGMTQAAGDATRGKTLFNTNCLSCHNTDATKKVGPGLKNVYSKGKLPNGSPVNDTNLTLWMKIGNDEMKGNPSLSGQDSADIEAYLKTLK